MLSNLSPVWNKSFQDEEMGQSDISKSEYESIFIFTLFDILVLRKEGRFFTTVVCFKDLLQQYQGLRNS